MPVSTDAYQQGPRVFSVLGEAADLFPWGKALRMESTGGPESSSRSKASTDAAWVDWVGMRMRRMKEGFLCVIGSG